METCTFILSGYHSSSDYCVLWETNGTQEDVISPFKYSEGSNPCDFYLRVCIKPGQYLFVREYTSDDTDDRILFRVPIELDQFAAFCKSAEEHAGQTVYDRINGYKSVRKGPFDYTNAFDGHWLNAYRIAVWDAVPENIDLDKVPYGLAKALELFSQKTQ